jgi:hypothetical protein
MKSAPLSVRLTHVLMDELQRLADADRRSLASYVEIVLQDHVKAANKPCPRCGKKQPMGDKCVECGLEFAK